MKLNNDRLAVLYQQGTSRAATRSACPSSDELIAAAIDDGPLDDTLARHIETCSDCAEEYRVAKALAPWATSEVARQSPRDVAMRRRPVAWLAVAASIAVIGVGVAVMMNRAPNDFANDNLRRVAPSSETVALIEPTGTIRSASPRFAWQAFATADAYRVHLFTGDGIPAWASDSTRETSIVLPSGVILPPGSYLWHVSATRAGDEVARSKVSAFTIEK